MLIIKDKEGKPKWVLLDEFEEPITFEQYEEWLAKQRGVIDDNNKHTPGN